MTFAPVTLRDLAAYWVSKGGVNLGIVGDGDHVNTGVSYHLGKSALKDTAYSRVLPRDVAGLTEAASAIDLGKLDGSLTELREFSKWLVSTLPVNGLVREVIYWNPDAGRVERWSGVDGVIRWGNGQGSLSHETHTHISFYRDTEFLAKTQLFAPYFATPTPPQEPAMPRILNPLAADGIFTTSPNGATVYRVHDGADGLVGANEDQQVVMQGTLEGFVADAWFTKGAPDGELRAYPKADGTFTPAPPVTTPGTPDEAAIRKDQLARDRKTIADHLLPAS